MVKLKQLKTQADLQTLQSKINPHFLYNALNSIAVLIHEDANKAEDMTLKLSKLFRYSINSPQKNFATVREEIEVVNTYFDIEKVRFGDRINFSSQADDAVRDKQIPRFLIKMSLITCILIDDEELARKRLRRLLKPFALFRILAEAAKFHSHSLRLNYQYG